jgi:hypothetical protein
MEPSAEPPALDASRPNLFVSADRTHTGGGKGTPSGGKENAVKWVKEILSTQIAGIIDRDDGNAEGERVHSTQAFAKV